MTTTINDVFAPAENVVARKVGDDLIILDLESGQYFGLDTVGCRVWELLEDTEGSLKDISALVHAEYDAPKSQIDADLIALANQLIEKNLIVCETE